MPNPNHLPYLIELLDDESAVVQGGILQELLAFGPILDEQMRKLDERQRQKLMGFLDAENIQRLRTRWRSWFEMDGDKAKLESALSILSDFLNGLTSPIALSGLLNDLAAEYSQSHVGTDLPSLARFLFEVKGLKGVEQTDYYHPANSNLAYVIQSRRGIPISLVCIYMLVGHKVGLSVQGCNFPGHFLAKSWLSGRPIFIDCYNGGRFLEEKDIMAMSTHMALGFVQDILNAEIHAETIVARVLNNLIRAYQHTGQLAYSNLMIELLKELQGGAAEHWDLPHE